MATKKNLARSFGVYKTNAKTAAGRVINTRRARAGALKVRHRNG